LNTDSATVTSEQDLKSKIPKTRKLS